MRRRRSWADVNAHPNPRHGDRRAGRGLSSTRSYNLVTSKIMVSLPEQMVHEIDEVAQERSMSRSALLAAAARREIARPNPDGINDAMVRSEQRFRAAGRLEAAELVRRDRDGRR